MSTVWLAAAGVVAGASDAVVETVVVGRTTIGDETSPAPPDGVGFTNVELVDTSPSAPDGVGFTYVELEETNEVEGVTEELVVGTL